MRLKFLKENLIDEKSIIKILKDYIDISRKPKLGSAFLTKDGTFINLGENEDDSHGDIISYLENEDIFLFDDHWQFSENFGYIRMNSGTTTDFNAYIEFLEDKPTSEQYDGIENWLYYVLNSGVKEVEINVPNSKSIRYSLVDYLPEDIIKKVKRYYGSGNLYESASSTIDIDWDGRGWILEDGKIISTNNGPHYEKDNLIDQESNVVRYNFGYERYIGLPKNNLTSAQYSTLEELLDLFFIGRNGVGERSRNIEINCSMDSKGDFISKIYNPFEYTPDDIIKKIKRYYSSGTLYESASSVVYKDISDLYHYKKSANDILGGYGDLSDNSILDSNKAIYINGELKGYIGLSEYEEDGTKLLGIGNFMILERGKGYGTQVINDLVSKYKNEFDLIYCFVDADNTGAISLYKKLGKVYDEDVPNDNDQYYVTFYDNGKYKLEEALNESLQMNTLKPIVQDIYDAFEEHDVDGSNQNCMLCTWATELQLRGEDTLPRPVYSPRDIIFSGKFKGEDIVVNPQKLSIKNKEDVIDKVQSAGNGSRFYCHVNWNDSNGGHEFLLVNIDNEIYVVDSQSNYIELIEEDDNYFNDVNFKNSYIVRLDDKDINQEILKYNNFDYVVEWDEDIDSKMLEESYVKDSMFFLSDKNMDGKTLEPRVPNNFLIKNGYEDSKSKRVCFAPSIDKALMAISQNLKGKKFFVHTPVDVDEKYIYQPSVKEVPDVKITGEVWYTAPVKLKTIGQIEVIEDDSLPGHTYTYGKDNSAELYGWNWEWVDSEESHNSKTISKYNIEEDYDPPYNAQQIKDNYGIELYNKLIKDPAHRWRMETGIELIHKEPTKEELERIWKNWQEMSKEQKEKSDKKSLELFGKTNEENYYDLITLYESIDNNKNIDDIETPEQLMDWMKENITYELANDEYGAEDDPPTKTAEEVIETGTGHCAEQSYLEYKVLDELGYFPQLIFVKENNSEDDYGADGSAHMFVVYQDEDEKYTYFEHSQEHNKGIHKFDSMSELLDFVGKNWWRYDANSDILEVRYIDEPITGVNNWELAQECHKYPVDEVLDISNNVMEEDVPLDAKWDYNKHKIIKEKWEIADMEQDDPVDADVFISDDVRDIIREINRNNRWEYYKFILDEYADKYIMLDPFVIIHDDALHQVMDNYWYPNMMGKDAFDYMRKHHDKDLFYIMVTFGVDKDGLPNDVGQDYFNYAYMYPNFNILTRTTNFTNTELYKLLGKEDKFMDVSKYSGIQEKLCEHTIKNTIWVDDSIQLVQIDENYYSIQSQQGQQFGELSINHTDKYLNSIYISESGKGIGTKVMSYLVDNDIVRELDVDLQNTGAQRLYRKVGFKPKAIVWGNVDGDGNDRYIMTTENVDSVVMYYQDSLSDDYKDYTIICTKLTNGKITFSDDQSLWNELAELNITKENVAEDLNKMLSNKFIYESLLNRHLFEQDDLVGKNRTKLEKDSEGNTLSKEQSKFLKDSKIRRSDGSLIICTHCSDDDFETFSEEHIGSNCGGCNGYGFYFHSYKVNNNGYGKNTYHCYLNIKNPFMFYDTPDDVKELCDKCNYPYDVDGYEYAKKDYEEFGNDYQDAIAQVLNGDIKLFTKLVKQAGYDGIWSVPYDEVVAFYPNQIKRITNENPTNSNNMNEGVYDDEEEDVSEQITNEFLDVWEDFYHCSTENILDLLEYTPSDKIDASSPMFILPNGKIVNVADVVEQWGYEYPLVHHALPQVMAYVILKDICSRYGVETEQFMYEQDGLLDNVTDEMIHNLTYAKDWARINCGTLAVESRFYCVLPNHMKSAQYYTLEEWLLWGEQHNKKEVLVFCGNEQQNQKYKFDELFVEGIMKKIKRFYSSGVLHEGKDNRKILYRGEGDSNYSVGRTPMAGLFYATNYDDASNFSDNVVKYKLDSNSKIYKGQSSLNYCIENDLMNVMDKDLKNMLGVSALIDMYEESSVPDGYFPKDEYLDDRPFFGTQLIAKKDLQKKGYDGAYWKWEDDLTPQQYQIWNMSVVEKVDQIKEDFSDIDKSEYLKFQSYVESIIDRKIKIVNRELDKFGFEVEYIDDYDFTENDQWIGVFYNEIQDAADVFPIAINIPFLYRECKKDKYLKDDLPYHIEKTIWHEVGHGIFEYLYDVFDLEDLDEEEVVEEYASYQVGDMNSPGDLLTCLHQYLENN